MISKKNLGKAYHGTFYRICLFLGGQEFQIQCKVVFQCPSHYLGKEYEAKNIEHFMEYSVNGETRGYGICEWNYRHTKEIPQHEVSHIEKVTEIV